MSESESATAVSPRPAPQAKPTTPAPEAKPATPPPRRPRNGATATYTGVPLEVHVDERGIERAMRKLKRKVAQEGVTKECKRRRCYEKPSVRKRRKARDAERRRRRKARRMARRNPR